MTFCRKELLKKVALVIFSIIFTLLILEFAFRFFYPVTFHFFIKESTKTWKVPYQGFFTKCFHPSRTLGYEFIPNNPKVGTNSLGMLDKERVKEKPKGVYRIICLGDSTTASEHFLKTNSDYPSILEKLLNEYKKRERFEVWNCGVPGYCAIQYCRALKEKWLRYDPDMVIIGFCLNDFHTTPVVVREDDKLVGYFPYKEILPKVSPFLLRHSELYRFIVMKLFFPKKDYSDDVFSKTRSYLLEMKKLLLSKKIRYLIVILGLPERYENYPSYRRRSYTQIKRVIKDYNIESVDIVPLFENYGPEAMRDNLGDEIHFNRKGNEIIAKAIFEYLNKILVVEKGKVKNTFD